VLVVILAMSARDVSWLKVQYKVWRAPPAAKRWVEDIETLGPAAVELPVSYYEREGYPNAEIWDHLKREAALRARRVTIEEPARELPHFLLPGLALAAFLAWKAAWTIGPRLVRRRQFGR